MPKSIYSKIWDYENIYDISGKIRSSAWHRDYVDRFTGIYNKNKHTTVHFIGLMQIILQ